VCRGAWLLSAVLLLALPAQRPPAAVLSDLSSAQTAKFKRSIEILKSYRDKRAKLIFSSLLFRF